MSVREVKLMGPSLSIIYDHRDRSEIASDCSLAENWISMLRLPAEAGEIDVDDISNWLPIEHDGACERLGFNNCRLLGLSISSGYGADSLALAMAAVAVSRRLCGFICIGNLLSEWTCDDMILNDIGVVEIEGIHYVAPDLMERWIVHEDFKLG